jgi:hypothetical protein
MTTHGTAAWLGTQHPAAAAATTFAKESAG